MEFSSRSEHAIHGLCYLSKKPGSVPTYVSEIARNQKVSESYLAKIFQSLSKRGIVTSYRGIRGGYSLSRNPEKITLKEIVQAVEGESNIFSCSAVKRSCKIEDECIIKLTFQSAEEKMYNVLDKTTLQDIIDELNYPELSFEKLERLSSQEK
ncbi:MAG: RrF2 family transcriptional regulator [Fidelibacterota bacterium]